MLHLLGLTRSLKAYNSKTQYFCNLSTIMPPKKDSAEKKTRSAKRQAADTPEDQKTVKKAKSDATTDVIETVVSKETSKKQPVSKKKTTKAKPQDPSHDDKSAKANGDAQPSPTDANFKITSWNVDGMRAWIKKGGLSYLEKHSPDIFCVQEIKCSMKKMPEELDNIDGYKKYWSCGQKEGYAGVGMFSKVDPLNVEYGLNGDDDEEGRVITAEFDRFFLVSTYVPNAGRKLVTLPKRLEWNEQFEQHVRALEARKPVIICGDMNVAHEEIDLTNPKTNKKNAGFTAEERAGMTDLLSLGYVDTFRRLYPTRTGAYTYWSYMSNARAKNIGWRLDYFLMSERVVSWLVDNEIQADVTGSDHCPIMLSLNLP